MKQHKGRFDPARPPGHCAIQWTPVFSSMPSSALRRLSFAALLLASRQAAAQCPDGTPPPCATPRRIVPIGRTVPAPDARARRFLLLPFRNVTRIAAQDWLVTGAPLMLGESLGQFHDLTVVSEEKLTAARRRLAIRGDSMPDATQLRRLAEETDGWTAISGNVYAAGPRLRIEVQATDVQSARVITRAKAEVAIDADVRQAFDSLTVLLVAPTGVRGMRADLTALTTQSADAYRAYVRGIEMLQRSAFHRATQAFTEAVSRDSAFAMAWARLAYSTTNSNPLILFDAASPVARALEQSVRLGARLPSRQLALVRAMQNYTRGQMRLARTTLDSLIATDRDDLDARELLALWMPSDLDLDTGTGPPRMASSMNRAVQLARDVLDRDPGRRNVYSVFATAYATAGGWFFGARMGLRGEFPSFGAIYLRLLEGADAAFVPVLRDSIVLVPVADFMRLPAAERVRLRHRSAEAGMEWVERWLVAGPQNAEAHLWASRLAELRGDAPRALREFTIAESLGVESAWENGPERRLLLLVRAEQTAAAATLADSLVRTGALRTRRLGAARFDHGRGYTVAAYLLTGRWADAGGLVASLGGGSACLGVINDISTPTGEVSGPALRAMSDSVARHLMAVAAVAPLAPCLGNLVLLVNDSTAGRRTVAGAALLAVADSLQRAGGNDALAYRAATWAWAADTMRHADISGRAWFGARSRTLARARHFLPAAATVEGDSVIFAFRANPAAPAAPAEAADSAQWSVRIEMRSSRTTDGVDLDLLIGVATVGDRATGSGALTRGPTIRVRKASNLLANRTMPTASIQSTADGFIVVARGLLVQDLRRLRPSTATFSAAPCVAVGDGLCGGPTIAISYR